MIPYDRPTKVRIASAALCACALLLCACNKNSNVEAAKVPVAEGSAKTKLNLRRSTHHSTDGETSATEPAGGSVTTQTL